MTFQVILDLPEDTLTALHQSPEQFARDIRLAAAAKWYEAGMLSQERAAQVAGLNRSAFIDALSRFGVSPFQQTPEELREELGLD